MCGRVIQASAPLRYAIVDGLDVRDSRLSNYPRRWNGAPSQEFLVIRQNHETGERWIGRAGWVFHKRRASGAKFSVEPKGRLVHLLPSATARAGPRTQPWRLVGTTHRSRSCQPILGGRRSFRGSLLSCSSLHPSTVGHRRLLSEQFTGAVERLARRRVVIGHRPVDFHLNECCVIAKLFVFCRRALVPLKRRAVYRENKSAGRLGLNRARWSRHPTINKKMLLS